MKDKATIGGKTQEEACAVIKEEYGGKQPGHQAMGKIAKLLGVDKGNIRWNKDKKEIQGKSDDGKQVIVLATAPE